ncbi:MAG: hypothetical protein PF447_13180, partial [Spirochaetaceae bacterium]|nr:hypothetical protein [Spirochaetaceae bacterium]
MKKTLLIVISIYLVIVTSGCPTPGENETVVEKMYLLSSIAQAHSLKSTYTVGSALGDVPQSAMDVFLSAIAQAQGVADDESVSQSVVDQAVVTLNQAG